MKEMATAVMYDIREIIYERESLRLDVLMIGPAGLCRALSGPTNGRVGALKCRFGRSQAYGRTLHTL